jgi:hypothetical protein
MMDELIDELRQGDICGEFECLLLRKHVTDCVTVGPCDMLVLDAKVRVTYSCPVAIKTPALGATRLQLLFFVRFCRYHRVPMFSPYGSVCCACAHVAFAPHPRLRQAFSCTLRSQSTLYFFNESNTTRYGAPVQHAALMPSCMPSESAAAVPKVPSFQHVHAPNVNGSFKVLWH